MITTNQNVQYCSVSRQTCSKSINDLASPPSIHQLTFQLVAQAQESPSQSHINCDQAAQLNAQIISLNRKALREGRGWKIELFLS
jgi:hypothetical protein